MRLAERNAPLGVPISFRLIPVQTYGDYFEEYRVHPELKFADADGRPCHSWSRGLLLPRHIKAAAGTDREDVWTSV